MRRLYVLCVFAFCLCFLTREVRAYDTLRLSIQRADSIFLKQNLLLLSQLYNIQAREALIIQAKAYPNPVISANLNAIDPQNDRFFNIGSEGQKEFGIEQLVILGGKRKSSISIARQNQAIAQTEFAELLRNLKLQLHTSIYLLGQYNTILNNYDKQLALLKVLIQSYDEQAKKGNLPVKDVIRLKTIHLRVSNNRIEVIAFYRDEIRKIQVLLHTGDHPVSQMRDQDLEPFLTIPEFNDLLTRALQQRPDFQIVNQQLNLAQANLRLQKQLAIPDVVLNSGYDQLGGAFKNQVQVGLSIPLPLWDRNKGNIKAASFQELNTELLIQQKKNEISSEVQSAWEEMKVGVEEYKKAKEMYTRDFNDVFDGVNENFRRQNISILEFVDFFEAYNESLADFQRIKTQLALSAEQINFVTASPVY
ncbi:TolC family protein [soil metagenome]